MNLPILFLGQKGGILFYLILFCFIIFMLFFVPFLYEDTVTSRSLGYTKFLDSVLWGNTYFNRVKVSHLGVSYCSWHHHYIIFFSPCTLRPEYQQILKD